MAARSDGGPSWQSWLSQGLTERIPAEETYADEAERVPSSLQQRIVPILRAANEVEKMNPRIAYLCRFLAFEVITMDPNSSGREVRQFKTRLLHRLEKDEQETKRLLATTDAREILKFYEHYCMKYLKEVIKDREELANYQTATVLYDVLKTFMPGNPYDKYAKEVEMKKAKYAEGVEMEKAKYAEGVEMKKASFSYYNILPLNMSAPTNPVMEIPEIKAAVELMLIDNLPKPKIDLPSASEVMDIPVVNDLFDWLWQTFGFQKSNVENQKEHLILLLANIDMRKGGSGHQSQTQNYEIHSDTITYLTRKIFQNYITWCQYLHLESNIKIPRGTTAQQPELLYIGLYLLIWGEASNVRFMPECLCYIFHHMAGTLYGIISKRKEDIFVPPFGREGSYDAFLQRVIEPIFTLMQEEAALSKCGMVSYSEWRNYDDLNECFWSKKCLKQLKWPMDLSANFFAVLMDSKYKTEKHDHAARRRMPKTNFVKLRTSLQLFRSFDRMWHFFTLAFQAMVIIAWSPSGSLSAIFEPTNFRNVTTIFITDAFLNLLQAMLEIVLNWKAWRSLEFSQMIRYIMKLAISLSWLIILPTAYISSVQDPMGHVLFFRSWIGNSKRISIYDFVVALYMLPSIFSAMLFVFPPFQRALDHSNSHIVRFFVWWTQPKLYIGQGMYNDTYSLLKYTLFWVLVLTCKLAFSFYVEISPLIGHTRAIVLIGRETKELPQNLGILIFTVWLPIIMVYFMDTQIWYAIFSTICGAIIGAISGVGEIRTLQMLTSRFLTIPRAFCKKLVPNFDSQPNKRDQEDGKSFHGDEFSDIWNAFIISLRDEDLISNSERDLLIVPSSLAMGETTVFQWPPFLLASKIPFALDMAKGVKNDEGLRRRINQDPYTLDAVIECYETLLNILYSLINEPNDKKVVDQIRDGIEASVRSQSLVKEFRLDELPQLSAKFYKLLRLLLKHYHRDSKIQIVTLLQDIMEIITKDIMKNGQGILKDESIFIRRFAKINLDSVKVKPWREQCFRIQLLLATKDSTTYLPINHEARRRIMFFANSLFMKMPTAPQVRNMMSFSVLTPYIKEEVLFSAEDLYKKNENGISILFYLRQLYPDEWRNFVERIDLKPSDEEFVKLNMDEICLWASYREQTLIRTVRGMMYYRRAIEIQSIQEKSDLDRLDHDKILKSSREARAIADIKFTYVVSCQVYGMQKNSEQTKDRACYLNILNLMAMHPSLRVAYIDEVEATTGNGTTKKIYYSVLVKGLSQEYDEEIYRIKLPGNPTDIGEGKPENKNNAIIFTRGEALQAIDTNQDNYLEEAFKMRNLLEEFENGKSKPNILGIREHYFTGSVSSLAWFMSNKENNIGTITQRVLANPLRVRFHCGHPDIFDRLFHITRGGISKASKSLNPCEGFNSTMREGNVTHYEYMQVGKGCNVEMNQISCSEAYLATCTGEQTLSHDIYQLGCRYDFYRMLSLYFTTVGFYFSSLVSVLAIYAFLYGRLYLIIVGLEKSILLDQRTDQENINPLESALATQLAFQLGVLLFLPMLMEVGLEKGFHTAFGDFVLMQIQLASVFFTFQFGTKAHYYGRTILHGGAKYRPTDRGFLVHHAKFAENYRMYSRSHFVKGLELLVLLVVYLAYGCSSCRSIVNLFLTFSISFMVVSWLYAPFIFNPSCFEWLEIVDDWKDWRKWMGNRVSIGLSAEQSWEVWWDSEQQYLRKTSMQSLLFEIILSLRFLIYQCGIVYYLNIECPSESILVQALSWLVMLAVLVFIKMDSIEQKNFGTDLYLMFRILKALVFLGSVFVMAVLLVVTNITICDVIIGTTAFIHTGWCVLLIGQVCSPFLRRTMLWDSIMELGRAYDNMVGLILFLPVILLSWIPTVSEIHTHLLFNKTISEGLQVSRILASQNTGDFE